MPIELRQANSKLFEREVKKFPWVAYCLESTCHFVVSAKDEEQAGESLGKHKCPYNGSSERLPEKPLMSAMWRELDACMDGIMLAKGVLNGNSSTADVTPDIHAKLSHWKSRASGIATCLFILLGGEPGYYVNQEDITREAVRRYKMRLGELAWEPTQGDAYDALRDGPTPRWETVVWETRQRGATANSQITPPPNKSTPPAQATPKRKRRVAQTPVATAAPLPTGLLPTMPGVGLPGMVVPRKLPDDVVNGIKNALAGGMDSSVVASIFQVDVSEVESLKGK